MKQLRLRRADACCGCDRPLDAGVRAYWDATERVVRCPTCAEAPAPQEASDTRPSTPGASARAEYERRARCDEERHAEKVEHDARWRREIVEQRPVLGRLTCALTARPTAPSPKQSTEAWRIGAEGEERVAEVLADAAVCALHDRRVPGSRANIDHLAITSAGVFVIDAKKYKGRIEVRNVGGMFRADERLFVGNRDRSQLAEGVRRQVQVVQTALGDEFERVPVRGVLCFVGADWGWRVRMITIDQITALWPLALADFVRSPSAAPVDVAAIRRRLETELRPAA